MFPWDHLCRQAVWPGDHFPCFTAIWRGKKSLADATCANAAPLRFEINQFWGSIITAGAVTKPRHCSSCFLLKYYSKRQQAKISLLLRTCQLLLYLFKIRSWAALLVLSPPSCQSKVSPCQINTCCAVFGAPVMKKGKWLSGDVEKELDPSWYLLCCWFHSPGHESISVRALTYNESEH